MASNKPETDKFTSRIDSIVTNAYLAVGLAIGHEHGLWEALAELDTPTTSTALADRAMCKERYVREWLKWMSVASILEVDDTGTLFCLPPERRAGVLSSMVGLASRIPALLGSHRQVTAVMRQDGPRGLTPEDVDPFFTFWENTRPKTFETVLPELISQLTGFHDQLERGIEVIDLGTSRGHLLHWMAARYPKSRFTGADIGEKALAEATDIAAQKGLVNVTFSYGDVTKLPEEWSGRFDLVFMFDLLHDLPLASQSVPEFYRILKPGGTLSVTDIYTHSNPKDNIGDAMYSVLSLHSIYYCLGTSMNTPGSEMLGTCVGIEKLISLIELGGFDFKNRGRLEKLGAMYVHLMCTKQ